MKLFVRQWCEKNLVPITERPDFEEWLASTEYTIHRKDELRQAFIDNNFHFPPPAVACKVKNFVKLETYPEYKHARWINSRCDRFKVFCGPFFKKIEEQVYETSDTVRFIKHIPVDERPESLMQIPEGLRYYGTDYTSFEKHFSKEIMETIEFVLYDYMLEFLTHAEKKCLFDTLSGYNKLKSRLGFQARVKARRMSGEMCTSLGNGFTNMMLALFLAHEKNGHIYGYVEGDDGIFGTDFEMTPEDYKRLGFEIKIKSYENVGDASFCGMIFSSSGQIIRDPVNFLMKFGWSSSAIGCSHRVAQELLRAKALSAAYETPHCPVVGAAVRFALNKTEGYAPRFVSDGFHKVPRDVINVPLFNPSSSTRLQFERLFKVSIADQLVIEDKLMAGDFDVAHLLSLNMDGLHYETRYVA